jgi:hypothetical protein
VPKEKWSKLDNKAVKCIFIGHGICEKVQSLGPCGQEIFV